MNEYDKWLRHGLLARSAPADDGRVKALLAGVAGHRDATGQPAMRFRRAASLVLLPYGPGITVYNFVTRRAFPGTATEISVLLAADDWCTEAWLRDHVSFVDEVAHLVELNALVVEGTGLAGRDEDYRRRWAWGPVAGLYHFACRDASYEDTLPEPVDGPILFRRHANWNEIPLPAVAENGNLWQVLRSRRSGREFSGEKIGRDALGAVLFGGFGITGFVEDVSRGSMPLTMSPSGGALNPFEGYVLVRAVDGLAPGIYHYSGFDHSLQLVHGDEVPPAGTLLAGQQWADKASAVVFLVANFARTMWKYRSAVSYRVVMIEAGHIGQNIQLVATQRDLLAAPTCALRESVIEDLLGVEAVDEAVVYAIALGERIQDGN